MYVLVFDTETTGLPRSRLLNPMVFHLWPHIVQFSYIIYDTETNNVMKIRDFIIRMPKGVIIPDDSIQIHGITNEISKSSGVDICLAFEDFFEDIKRVDQVVGHNIVFDLNMLKIELLRIIDRQSSTKEEEDKKLFYKNILYEITYVTNFRCTMQETTEYCNLLTKGKKGDTYKKFPTLLELYKKLYNATPVNLHNSLNDVLITLVCFMKFNYGVNVADNCSEIENMLSNVGFV